MIKVGIMGNDDDDDLYVYFFYYDSRLRFA